MWSLARMTLQQEEWSAYFALVQKTFIKRWTDEDYIEMGLERVALERDLLFDIIGPVSSDGTFPAPLLSPERHVNYAWGNRVLIPCDPTAPTEVSGKFYFHNYRKLQMVRY